MPTLFHAPMSRSSGIVTLIDELGADVDIRQVSVARADGSGAPDPANPHPEGKVPFLVDGAETVRERGAITLYLTDKYPEAGLGPIEGSPGRGEYLSWLFYYQGVMEPLFILQAAGVSHPVITGSLRDMDTMLARLTAALRKGPWLLGEQYSAADMLCSSPFQWFTGLLGDHPEIRDWVERCVARPAVQRTLDRDSAVPA
jgi:glutathione S-transferase